MTRHATRPTRPPHKFSSDEEEPILPTPVIGLEASNNWCTAHSGNHLVSPLVLIMFLQVIRKKHLPYLALDPVLNTQAFQGHQHHLCIWHQLTWCDLVMIAHVPNQFWDREPHPVLKHQLLNYHPTGHNPVHSLMGSWNPDLYLGGI